VTGNEKLSTFVDFSTNLIDPGKTIFELAQVVVQGTDALNLWSDVGEGMSIMRQAIGDWIEPSAYGEDETSNCCCK
jgi:hypothetical protein